MNPEQEQTEHLEHREQEKIKSEWNFLGSILLEAGFREEGTINRCLKRFVGDQAAFDKLIQTYPPERYKNQIYIILKSSDRPYKSRIICQPEGDHHIAWLS